MLCEKNLCSVQSPFYENSPFQAAGVEPVAKPPGFQRVPLCLGSVCAATEEGQFEAGEGGRGRDPDSKTRGAQGIQTQLTFKPGRSWP